jgi:hypothetical protein
MSKIKILIAVIAAVLATGGAAFIHASASKKFYQVQSPLVFVQPDSVAQAQVTCHEGDLATGGGFQVTNDTYVAVEDSEPNGPGGWGAAVYNGDPVNAHGFFVIAMCEHDQ